MEKLMNRIVGNPNLLEDEKLNAKIEKFFDNQTFQKMVEGTDVFQDMSNMSFTNSILIKQQKPQAKVQGFIGTESSWDMENDNKLLQSSSNSNKTEQFLKVGLDKRGDAMQQMLPNDLFQQSSKKINTETGQTPASLLIPEFSRQGDHKRGAHIPPHQSAHTQLQSKQLADASQKKLSFNEEEMPSMIKQSGANNQDDTSLFGDINIPEVQQDIDEYEGNEDPGFDLYEVKEKDFERIAKQLAEKYGFPGRSCKFEEGKQREFLLLFKINSIEKWKEMIVISLGVKEVKIKAISSIKSKFKKIRKRGLQLILQYLQRHILLPLTVKHPKNQDDFYPVEYDNIIYDCFFLKVIYDRERTGFEETKDFPIVINSIIAGRYQVIEYLGSAAFSKAIQCLDLTTNQMVCMKVIENNKDYYDQSIDEIKLLKYININGNVDEKNCLQLIDYFYHKEHLFIVTELLKDNLYEYQKFNKENEKDYYFTIGRLQKITKQVLIALDYIHTLRLIHCDLKPENILIKSYSKCEVKVIDFGSSCYIHDHLSSYVQSRSYRAPEVIIGCKYDYKIDLWSLGCILAEMHTGYVLFQNDTVQGLLARVIGIIGPFSEKMINEGRLVGQLFTKEKLLFQDVYEEGEQSQNFNENSQFYSRKPNKTGNIQILVPKHSSLKNRLRTETGSCNDMFFLDFLKKLLEIDPSKRPTAAEALQHPWLTQAKYPDGL